MCYIHTHKQTKRESAQQKGDKMKLLERKEKTEVKRYYLDGNRYLYDVKLAPSDGWAQIDTSIDAWYYGQWANPVELKYIVYCEGDVYEAVFATEADFIKKITHCAKMDSFLGIDTLCDDSLTKAFKAIGLENLLH